GRRRRSFYGTAGSESSGVVRRAEIRARGIGEGVAGNSGSRRIEAAGSGDPDEGFRFVDGDAAYRVVGGFASAVILSYLLSNPGDHRVIPLDLAGGFHLFLNFLDV